jgi:signal transduction histidine kinase
MRLDVAIALCLFGVGLAEVLGAPIADDVVEGARALNVLAVALTTLPLALRRRAPVAVAMTIFAAIALRALIDEPLEIYPPTIAALIALYTLGAYASLRDALLASGVFVLALAIAADRGTGTDATPQLVPAYILSAGVLAMGRIVQLRHARAAAVEEQAAAAVSEERARLARDLHDGVSHSLGSIALLAGGAQDVLRNDPDRAAQSLAAIERAARAGLGEMRRLLGLIGDGAAPREPQPTLARLEELIASAREAGLDARAEVEGDAAPLAAAVDVSAFRIVQEALTNVMKHGGRCRVIVRVSYLPGALELHVVDDGAGSRVGAGTPGRGLAGMRERVDVLGGEFDAGPQPQGGFLVRARLPVAS